MRVRGHVSEMSGIMPGDITQVNIGRNGTMRPPEAVGRTEGARATPRVSRAWYCDVHEEKSRCTLSTISWRSVTKVRQGQVSPNSEKLNYKKQTNKNVPPRTCQ